MIRPGGTFAGTDSVGTGRVFRLIHIGDTLVLVDPGTLPERLAAGGMEGLEVALGGNSFRVRARNPA